LAAWIGGDDADAKAHLIASLLMGLVITRETTRRFGPEDAQTKRLSDLLATQLQDVLKR
jgi:hypothetical protein